MASDYVWTVRDPNGEVVGISAHGREAALRDARECDRWLPRHERALNAFFEYQGWRVQREPLTPAPVVPVVSEAMVEAAERARTGFAWAAEKVEALHEYASKRVNDRSVVKSLGGIAEQLRVSEVAAENHRAALTAAPVPPVVTEATSLVAELTSLLNRYSAENGSNTPDFILADFLRISLAAFDGAVVKREHWYGRSVTAASEVRG